jgi:hypothetical protein
MGRVTTRAEARTKLMRLHGLQRRLVGWIGLVMLVWCGFAFAAAPAEALSTPALVTTASPGTSVGLQIFDVADLSGGNDPTGTVTFMLFGPGDTTCTTPIVTSTVSVNGDGTYGSEHFTTAEAGTYEWEAVYSGDANNNPAGPTACGDPLETVVVSTATPTLSTFASEGVPAGGAVSDTATLAGGATPSGTLTFSLFGPGDATCSGTPVFTATISVSGDGHYLSGAFTVAAAGTYEWVSSYSGDADNGGVLGGCGVVGESVVVSQAVTSTVLGSSVDPSVAGQPVSFTATVSGSAPTGTVTFEVGSAVFGMAMVGAGGRATFTAVSPPVGVYGVTAVYGGDGNNLASTSSVLTQTVVAQGAPSVSIAVPGLSGSYAYGQAVIASYGCLEGAGGPGIAACVGTVPDGAKIATEPAGKHSFTVVAVSGDGQRASETVTYTVRLPSNRFTVTRIKTSPDGVVSFDLKLPGAGVVDVLETAWKDNFATAASVLEPGPGRFVFARKHVPIRRAGKILVTARPNPHAKSLIAHHRYRVLIRLWVSYTPTGSNQRNTGRYGVRITS